MIPASSSNDAARGYEGIYYSSSNEDRLSHSEQRLIEQNDILNLSKGHAMALVGGNARKLRMPLIRPETIDVPPNLENMLPQMRKRYVGNMTSFKIH